MRRQGSVNGRYACQPRDRQRNTATKSAATIISPNDPGSGTAMMLSTPSCPTTTLPFKSEVVLELMILISAGAVKKVEKAEGPPTAAIAPGVMKNTACCHPELAASENGVIDT